MEVKLRNAGKAEATITYSLLRESAPQVTADVSVRPGKYRIGYGGLIRSHPKLATGTVEPAKGDTLPPSAKVTKVSRPYFERGFED